MKSNDSQALKLVSGIVTPIASAASSAPAGTSASNPNQGRNMTMKSTTADMPAIASPVLSLSASIDLSRRLAGARSL